MPIPFGVIMSRYQLYLAADAADSTGKTTSVMIRRIRLMDAETWYIFPEEYQKLSNHPQLALLSPVKAAASVLKTRGQYRNVNVTLPTDVEKLYIDEDENFIFKDFLLPESRIGVSTSATSSSDPAISELVSSLNKITEDKEESVKAILKHFLVEKFSARNRNVEAWCQSFEKESERFSLTGQRQIEVFKSCLDISLADWFSINQKRLGLTAPWKDWKSDLISTFGDSSWKPIRYAFNFKYFSGSYIDYAIRKEKMLLDLDRNLPDLMILDLIVVGLPNHVQNSLNRNSVTSVKILHSKLKKFEAEDKIFENITKSKTFSPSASRRNLDVNKKGRTFSNSTFEKKHLNLDKDRKPCSICSKIGYPGRLHSESACWFKDKEPANLKTVNNVEMVPKSLLDEDQKNE